MDPKYVKEYSDMYDEQQRIAVDREKPVTVESISSKQPLNVLQNLIEMWPCTDVRYEGHSSDDDLLVDMVQSMQQRFTRKSIQEGIIEYTVEMLRNLDEIERYNAAVQQHNEKWVAEGKPTEIFDAFSGDVSKNRDGYVDPVLMSSKHFPIPDSAYSNTARNKLSKARPDMRRKSHIRVKYQMSINIDNQFVLGYAAYDHADRVIFFNETIHKDLAYLVRRSVQEIWGNPKASKIFDPLLVGIQMLINGDKLELCKKRCKFPEFMAKEQTTLKSTKEIRNLENNELSLIKKANFFGFYLPIFYIICFVVLALWSFLGMAGERFGADNIIPVVGCTFLLILTLISRGFSQTFDRMASETKARRQFI